MSDVYIGFMDEEVRPILTALFNKGWNVLVIERNDIKPQGVLFERPIAAYGTDVLWRGWCGFSENNDFVSVHNTIKDAGGILNPARRTWLDVFQQCVYMNFMDVYRKLPSGILEQENGKAIKRKLGLLPSLSMLYMGNAKGRSSGLPTKILIRSPEMGMQPGLIRTQLRGLLKSIRSASNATKDDSSAREANSINLWSYGAGGAFCTPESEIVGGPGEVWDIQGSVYVGVERDKGAELRRSSKSQMSTVGLYTGEISYCSKDANENLYQSPAYYFTEQARADVEGMFISSSREDNLLNKQTRALTSQLDQRASRPAERAGISITANTFIGEAMKTAARDYGLLGEVNMEDYHLLKLIHSMLTSQTKFTSVKSIEDKYPTLDKFRVIRIDADPAEVSPLSDGNSPITFQRFTEANPTTISAQDYASVVTWGLMGMKYSAVPDAINWHAIASFMSSYLSLNVGDFLVTYTPQLDLDDQKYINPFLLEAAQDMYTEVGEWLARISANPIDVNKAKHVNAVNSNPFNIKAFDDELEQVQRLRSLIESYENLTLALDQYCTGTTDEIDVELTTEFVKALYSYLYGRAQYAESALDIWARGGWGIGNDQPYFVENVIFNGSLVDRALYKSNNTTVLDNCSNEAVNYYFS